MPRASGSIERRDSIRGSDEGGKSLNVSAMHRLYGCCGLKSVAFGNLYFFQYSSDGEPHSLNILCSCSTLTRKEFKGFVNLKTINFSRNSRNINKNDQESREGQKLEK